MNLIEHSRAVFVQLTFVIGLLLAPGSAAMAAERKVALVIGNSTYLNSPKLPNAASDAVAIAFLLKAIGFSVEAQNDLTIGAMRQALRQFADTARGAEIAIVYFAGHGIEVDGANYLIPVDAKLATDLDVEDEAISLDRILRTMEPALRLRLVLLDACRDNPFLRSMKRLVATRSLGRGLGRVDPSTSDTLVAFAAKAGSIASDGTGPNSPFTGALLKYLGTPGVDVRLALGQVRDEVLLRTDRRQEPFVYGSLGGGTIALAGAPHGRIEMPISPSEPRIDARYDFDLADRVGSKAGWELFLARHPSGFYAELARARLRVLSGEDKKLGTPTVRRPKIQPKNAKTRKSLPETRQKTQVGVVPRKGAAYTTCGPRGCQTVPAGCTHVPRGGGFGLGGRIDCP